MLRSVPHTVPRVGRLYEHFPDGFELHLLLHRGWESWKRRGSRTPRAKARTGFGAPWTLRRWPSRSQHLSRRKFLLSCLAKCNSCRNLSTFGCPLFLYIRFPHKYVHLFPCTNLSTYFYIGSRTPRARARTGSGAPWTLRLSPSRSRERACVCVCARESVCARERV